MLRTIAPAIGSVPAVPPAASARPGASIFAPYNCFSVPWRGTSQGGRRGRPGNRGSWRSAATARPCRGCDPRRLAGSGAHSSTP